jgi:hypothetical protein
VHLKSGSVLRWQCPAMLANPQRPLTQEQYLMRIHRCRAFATEPLAPEAPDRLVQVIDGLEQVWDLRSLLHLMPSCRV